MARHGDKDALCVPRGALLHFPQAAVDGAFQGFAFVGVEGVDGGEPVRAVLAEPQDQLELLAFDDGAEGGAHPWSDTPLTAWQWLCSVFFFYLCGSSRFFFLDSA